MAKRYIILCRLCDRLAEVHRRDARSCGGVRCRVWRHRQRDFLAALRAKVEAGIGRVSKQDEFTFLELGAIHRLRPDLFERIHRGELQIADCRPELVATFWQLVSAAFVAERAGDVEKLEDIRKRLRGDAAALTETLPTDIPHDKENAEDEGQKP